MAAKQTRRNKRAPGGARVWDPRLLYSILALVALFGLAWVGYTVASGGGAVVDPIEITGLDDPAALVAQAQGVSRGDGNAPVTVRVFSDFTCPGCRMFAQNTEPLLRATFVDSGKVRLVYHDLPLGGEGQHRWGFLGARAARCADEQGRFWEYHDLLFDRQTEWSASGSAPVDALVGYADLLDMDPEAFRACVESDRHADVVTANGMMAIQLGVGSTPTVFVGSRSVPGWSDWDEVRGAVERELGASGS